MERFGKAVVRCRYGILILAILLLIPSILGYRGTRINYDVLTYLPKDIETMKGQEILTNEFGTGALSMMVVEDMSLEEVSALKEEIVKIRVICVGKLKERFFAEAAAEYCKRLSAYARVEIAEVADAALPAKVLASSSMGP